MTFTVLVALGPNDVVVPCLVFQNYDIALQHVTELLGAPDLIEGRGSNMEPFWEAPSFRNIKGEDGEYHNPDSVKPFFLRYYGGCGDVYGFRLKRVEEGKPFVEWDLD